MNLDRITLYQSGWACPKCAKYNATQGFFCHKCGDTIHCHFCRSDFLVATMSIEDDPTLRIESEIKKLESSIALSIENFIENTDKLPHIIIRRREHHPKEGAFFQVEVKLKMEI